MSGHRRFVGRVETGSGGAARAVNNDDRLDRIERETGIRCVPGTLNVEIGRLVDLSGITPCFEHLFPRTPSRLGPVRVHVASISKGTKSRDCILFRHVGTSYRTKLELMASENLRRALGLEDDDDVEVVVHAGPRRR